MHKRLLIVSAIIFTALIAFAVLGYHSISLHEDGLVAKRSMAFSEVAEQIRIDVKQKLDKFIQTEQKRPYTDYQYFYAPEIANNGSNNVLFRSPLAKKMSHGMAYGHFQIEPDGTIVSPFYTEGQDGKLDDEKQLYVSNVYGNIANSLNGSATAYLEIQRKALEKQNSHEKLNKSINLRSIRGAKTSKALKPVAKNKKTSKQQQSLAKGQTQSNFDVNFIEHEFNETQTLVQSRNTVMVNRRQNDQTIIDNINMAEDVQAVQISEETLNPNSQTRIQAQNGTFQERYLNQPPAADQEDQTTQAQTETSQRAAVRSRTASPEEPAAKEEQKSDHTPSSVIANESKQLDQAQTSQPANAPQGRYDPYTQKFNINGDIADTSFAIPQGRFDQNMQLGLKDMLAWQTNQQNPDDMVQIRIEPFVPITVKAGAPKNSFFGSQVFLLRHVQIEDSHFLQGFRLNEKELISEIKQSASQLLRDGMGFQVSSDESPNAAHAAILDFGFGQLVLNLMEQKPLWIANQVNQLKNWYFAIVTVVLVATLLALISLWRNFNAQTRLARKKDDFISAVSHELRTPLTTIRMYTEMLENNWIKTEDKRTEYYGTMRQESERLSRLIENVLDFSRIQRGKKRYNFALGDINSCVKEVVEMMTPCAAKQDFKIITELSDDIKATSFDSDAVMQIVINLVDNALKYSAGAEDKTITVRTRTEGRYVLIEVADHGPGIPNTQRKKIFDEFYRIGEESKRETTGTGLGLALVKRFANAHNGFVEALSAKPNGALLRVALSSTTA